MCTDLGTYTSRYTRTLRITVSCTSGHVGVPVPTSGVAARFVTIHHGDAMNQDELATIPGNDPDEFR
jgi:hypothetical protein